MNIIKILAFRTVQGVTYLAEFLLPWKEPELITGAGAINKLPQRIKKDGYDCVLIVTDKGLMKFNLLAPLFKGLDEAGIKYSLYDGTEPNPTFTNIDDALKLYKSNGCKAIVAFGGGSPMDCAKGVGARLAHPDKTLEDMRGYFKVRKNIPMFYAVPTTAGTGSETTVAAVVTNPQTHEKFAINDPSLRPKCAVLDPELTVSLPPHITSTTGMDALTHAVEAYIGRSNTKGTKADAKKAVKLIFDNIEKAYTNGSDIDARQNMLVASYHAGLAFTRAYVGYVHAVAHSLGGLYGIPHGLANAVILPVVLEAFGESAYKKLAELAEAAGLEVQGKTVPEKAKLFISEIYKMNERMNIPTSFDNIQDKDIDTIANRAYKEGNPMYPVPKIFSREDLKTVIRRVKK